MGTIRFGVAIADARGSVSGNVFTRNKAGAVLRNRVKGVNPRSTAQLQRRNTFTTLALAWAALASQAIRNAWTAYAAATTWLNRLGDPITVNGNSAFTQANALRLLSGQDMLTVAPLTGGRALPLTNTVVAYVGDDNVGITSFDPAYGVDVDEDTMLLYMSPARPAGQAALPKRWYYLGAVIGNHTTPPPPPILFATPFPLTLDQVHSIKCVHLGPDGKISTPTYADATVVAPPGP